MVRQGLLGTLTHAEGAYLHDLRDTLNEQDGHGNDISEAVWRRAKYQSDLWRRVGGIARSHGGHGGQDFVMLFRIMECLHQGLTPDFNVYDAAAWSSPFPLSVESVRTGGGAMAIPDFTSGHWN